MRTLVIVLASAGFVGYIPVASATFGSLVGIPLFWLLATLSRTSATLTIVVFAAFVAASCGIAGLAEAYLNEHDSHKIVIDEIAGYLAATLFLHPDLRTAVIAFFVFRFFDIVKVFPARYIDQNVSGGYGIVFDDVVAGVYSNLVTRAVIALWPLAMAA